MTRVVLADDQALVRAGFVALLDVQVGGVDRGCACPGDIELRRR